MTEYSIVSKRFWRLTSDKFFLVSFHSTFQSRRFVCSAVSHVSAKSTMIHATTSFSNPTHSSSCYSFHIKASARCSFKATRSSHILISFNFFSYSWQPVPLKLLCPKLTRRRKMPFREKIIESGIPNFFLHSHTPNVVKRNFLFL